MQSAVFSTLGLADNLHMTDKHCSSMLVQKCADGSSIIIIASLSDRRAGVVVLPLRVQRPLVRALIEDIRNPLARAFPEHLFAGAHGD